MAQEWTAAPGRPASTADAPADPANDPQRPQYHFLPPANWLNDPNGLIQWQGEYHLFYQYNPHGAFHGTIHWGHAVSADLVHWRHLPIALAPTPNSPDEDGCWSGCAVDDNGVPTLIYSGHRKGHERTCIATSSDNLLTWDKHFDNPVIPETPALDLVAYRDHSVWREGETWYQVIGAGIAGVGGTALLYRSPDLRQWDYVGPLAVGSLEEREPLWTGSMWECPSFFALGDKHVLVVSVWDNGRLYYTAYFVGTYQDFKFVPERSGKLDFGDHYFYAPQTMLDDQGRRLVFGWIQEGRSGDAQRRAGWSGVMSLPRELRLAPDNTLEVHPVAELGSLREAHRHFAGLPLGAEITTLPGVAGAALEIGATIEPGDAQRVELRVRRSADGAEETIIAYDRAQGRLLIDRQRASRDNELEHSEQGGPLQLAPDEPLRLQVFVDHSVVEVFANGRASLTTRVYPVQADSLAVALSAQGGAALAAEIDSWELASSWHKEA